MTSDQKNFVSEKVTSLLSHFVKEKGPLRPPVDPCIFADQCGVLSIEHRPMIPEGVLTPVKGGFRIYLQNNFLTNQSLALRQRFTLAHELAHTFFYDMNGEVPAPTKPSPKGSRLEHLCHIGASQILVPEILLRQELKTKGEIASVEAVIDLAKVFNVSTEVIIRRLHAADRTTDYHFAAVLVDTSDRDKSLIRAACWGPPLLCHVSAPKVGLAFEPWVRPLLPSSSMSSPSEWTHATPSGMIVAKKVSHSSRSFMLDLRFDPSKSQSRQEAIHG